MKKQFLFKTKISNSFGGELQKGKRKTRRPLDVKRPLHLVLRADVKEIKSFLRYTSTIEGVLQKYSHKFGVRIYEKAINKNHLHFVIKFNYRLNYQSFVRAVAGVLAGKLKIRWVLRPFSRIVYWGKDFKKVCQYVHMNFLEAHGIIVYQPRGPRQIPL